MISCNNVSGFKVTLTERGQVSLPASLRQQLRLKAGQKLVWERISDTELRLKVLHAPPTSRTELIGFAARFRQEDPRSTHDWMGELREGDED